MSPALPRIILYISVVLTPFLVVATSHLRLLTSCFIMSTQLAFAIIAIQVVLAVRRIAPTKVS